MGRETAGGGAGPGPAEGATIDEVALAGGLDAVPVARRFVRSTLARWGRDDLAADAEIAGSELVTNAMLHVGPPVRLAVRPEGDAVRIEVHDTSRISPVRPAVSDGMTGRGLALVAALADRWGVGETPDGKVVWAVLTAHSVVGTAPAAGEIDALLAAFADEWDQPSRYTVTLGDVPTDLLLAAKSHVDSLAREFALAAGGARAGLTAEVPTSLVQLVEAVISEFAEARIAIKRQALAAATRGESRTSLTLSLPVSAADAGERYLAALEHADAYARGSRLLTLAAPARHQVFRRWYVTSLVTALRRAALGRAASPSGTFEQFLLREIDHVDALRTRAERAARLQRVTAALAGAMDEAQVGEILLAEAIRELAADRGALVLADQPEVRVVAHQGYPPGLLDRLQPASRHTPLPGTEVIRSGESVWVEDAEQRDQRFPLLVTLEPDTVATAAVPLRSGARLLGALRISYGSPRLFDDDERGFLTALAALAAQALERAALYELQTVTAARLGRLQQLTAALAAAHAVADVTAVVVEQAAALLGAEVAALSLLAADRRTLHVVRVHTTGGHDDAMSATLDIDDALPVAEAVRTGRILAVGSVAERDARWPLLRGRPPRVEHALVTLPLRVEAGVIGALSLAFPSTRRLTQGDLDMLTALADACAQSLERAENATRAEAANARLGFLARASIRLAESLDLRRTLADVARLAVPEIADWCVVHLIEDGELATVALAHADPGRLAISRELQRRWPDRLADRIGVGAVVRSGEPALLPAVTEAMLADGVGQDPERSNLLRRLGLSSVVIAPLSARGRTLGAVSLAMSDSGRHYGPEDLAFVLDLALRAALAIDSAALIARLREP